MLKASTQVHRILEYILTKAIISGEPKGTTIRIPYSELAADVGKESNKQIDLVVEIALKWDEQVVSQDDALTELEVTNE